MINLSNPNFRIEDDIRVSLNAAHETIGPLTSLGGSLAGIFSFVSSTLASAAEAGAV